MSKKLFALVLSLSMVMTMLLAGCTSQNGDTSKPPEESKAGGESAVPRITTSAARIDELMTLLVDNQVGPAGLHDVVADWL